MVNIIDVFELENIFTYHAPHGDQTERYGELRAAAKAFAELVVTRCPESRERSIALTRVREAIMWANASIAINEAHEAPLED